MPDEISLPSTARPDVPTRILNYLQEYKQGRTEQQLALHFSFFPSSVILVALRQLQKDDCVTFADGAWSLKRDVAK
jgi:hypothetical protein